MHTALFSGSAWQFHLRNHVVISPQDLEKSPGDQVAHHVVTVNCQMQTIVPQLVTRGLVQARIRDLGVEIKGVANGL